MYCWIDSHCHLDLTSKALNEFFKRANINKKSDASNINFRKLATQRGVKLCVTSSISSQNFNITRDIAHSENDAYALGIHPWMVAQSSEKDLIRLESILVKNLQTQNDTRLVALGEIGLDFALPDIVKSKHSEKIKNKQIYFFETQLNLAQHYQLPVQIHAQRSLDIVHQILLKALRNNTKQYCNNVAIIHAFNGSKQQAYNFFNIGCKLGFGGGITNAKSYRLRNLASSLPLESIVLETDSPSMPPKWLLSTNNRPLKIPNNPAHLPRIGAVLAYLLGTDIATIANVTTNNALQIMPRLKQLL